MPVSGARRCRPATEVRAVLSGIGRPTAGTSPSRPSWTSSCGACCSNVDNHGRQDHRDDEGLCAALAGLRSGTGDYDLVYCHMYATPLRVIRCGAIGAEARASACVRHRGQCRDEPAKGSEPQSAGPPAPRDRQVSLPDPDGRPCHRLVARARRATAGRSTGRVLHLHFLVSRHRPLRATAAEPASGPVTIGWTGTFSSTALSRPARGRVPAARDGADFKLRVIGNFDLRPAGRRSRGRALDRRTGGRAAPGHRHRASIRCRSTIGCSGKSGLKAIQYMALGLPCVATEVGTTPMLIRDGENGLLVRTEDEWLDALERLLRDPALREAARRGGPRRMPSQNIRRKAIAGAVSGACWTA